MVPAYPGCPGPNAVTVVCVCVCVCTTLLFGSECWTLYRKHIKQLEQFHMRCLRKIVGIRWQDRVSNTRVLEMCGISGIGAFLLQSQYRWVGHIVRMPDFRIPKQAFFGLLASGCRLQGGPVRRHKDSLKSTYERAIWLLPCCGLHPLTGVSGDSAAQMPYRLSRRGAQQLLSPTGRPGRTLLLQEGR